MVKTYGDKMEALRKATLPPKVLRSIGRLIRAIANLEDILTLYIAALTDLKEGPATRLVGKLSVTGKISTAQYLAKLHGGLIITTHTQLFTAAINTYIETRNHLAHGYLLGKTEEGRFAFVVYSPLDPLEGSYTTETVSYAAEDIQIFATDAERHVKAIAKILGVEEQQKKRLQLSLRPHRNARKSGAETDRTQKKSSKRKPRRPSARERRKQREREALEKAAVKT